VAFCRSLNRISGKRTDGTETDVWGRTTVGCHRIGGRWMIAHEHASVPLYMDGSDRAASILRSRSLAGGSVDDDLETMTREELIGEARRLRAGIRAHRDSTGHALCWHHPRLWGLLPEKTDPLPTVPTWPEFLRGCLMYRQSLDEQLPDARRSEAPYQP
jgi:hypothetical protein